MKSRRLKILSKATRINGDAGSAERRYLDASFSPPKTRAGKILLAQHYQNDAPI